MSTLLYGFTYTTKLLNFTSGMSTHCWKISRRTGTIGCFFPTVQSKWQKSCENQCKTIL